MSRRPWMPLYTYEFLAEASRLSLAETGAYIRLLCFYWEHWSLPQNEEAIRKIAGMSQRQWKRSYPSLRALFADCWAHHQLDHRIRQAIEISRVNSANAQRSHSDRIHTYTHKVSKKEEPVDNFRKPTLHFKD